MCRNVGDRRAFWNRRDDWSGRRHRRAHMDVFVSRVGLYTRLRDGCWFERQIGRRYVPFLAFEVDFGPVVACRIDVNRRPLR